MRKNSPEYDQKYHQMNKERRNAKARERNASVKAIVDLIKLEHGCSVCGYRKSARALQYHHENDDKSANVSKWVGQGQSIKKIMAEIDKCVLLCSNCHAELHERLDAELV